MFKAPGFLYLPGIFEQSHFICMIDAVLKFQMLNFEGEVCYYEKYRF